jgi:hypothetical protein
MPAKIRLALDSLESAAHLIVRDAGLPTLRGKPSLEWYQFPDSNVPQVAAVKAVRIVSGLNAVLTLHEQGFSVECSVLFRTIDDFIAEIAFLIDGDNADPFPQSQQDFVDQFFAASIDTQEEMLEDRNPARVIRRKIIAAYARYLNSKDWSTTERTLKAVFRNLDGYVHGSYPHSMELFDPNLRGGEFRMKGRAPAPHVMSIEETLILYTSRSLSLFGMLALKIGNGVLRDELVEARNRLESTI